MDVDIESLTDTRENTLPSANPLVSFVAHTTGIIPDCNHREDCSRISNHGNTLRRNLEDLPPKTRKHRNPKYLPILHQRCWAGRAPKLCLANLRGGIHSRRCIGATHVVCLPILLVACEKKNLRDIDSSLSRHTGESAVPLLLMSLRKKWAKIDDL